jgi:regulatory protein
MEAALRFLEPRARSTDEVRRRLTSAGYRSDLVDIVIARLTDLGVLDDLTFARDWLRSRDRARPRGERALRAELRAKGIPDATVATVLDDRRVKDEMAGRTTDEEAAARLLERRRAMLLRSGGPREVRQRAYALLVRNGFGSELAWTMAATIAGSDEDHDAGGGRRDPATTDGR